MNRPRPTPGEIAALTSPMRLVGLVTLLVVIAVPAASSEWRRYTNARTGASAEYPADQVADGPSLDLTDGLPGASTRPPIGISLSSDDGVEVRIYGMEASGAPYAQMCAQGCEGETYVVNRPGLAVVSGRQGSLITYRRCHAPPQKQGLHCFDLEYPEAKQVLMRSIIDRMTRTLR